MPLTRRSIYALFVLIMYLGASCTSNKINKEKNIDYSDEGKRSHELNIFYPEKTKSLNNVLIFIHGGNWNSGNKSMYSFIGRRFAKKGIVTVVIGYPYAPSANYKQMAKSCAMATSWIDKNISLYGGNPKNIFVSGHSAGGHLASLISLRDENFDNLKTRSPIKGVILIDAAGLDMYGYLKKHHLPKSHHYYAAFGNDQTMWKDATPLYHLSERIPPFLIFMGEKTYPSIKESNEKFLKEMHRYVPNPNFKVLRGKKHVPMITQFFNSKNPIYNDILEFMRSEK